MTTRERRLAEFEQGAPPTSQPLELLCLDKSGTYQLPFLCVWREGRWTNAETGDAIDSEVMGWRTPKPRRPARDAIISP